MAPPIKYCKCGTLIWAGGLPRYTERIICPLCQKEHSRQPPPWWLLRMAWGRLGRRRRYFGLRRMWGFELYLAPAPEYPSVIEHLCRLRLRHVHYAMRLFQVRST